VARKLGVGAPRDEQRKKKSKERDITEVNTMATPRKKNPRTGAAESYLILVRVPVGGA